MTGESVQKNGRQTEDARRRQRKNGEPQKSGLCQKGRKNLRRTGADYEKAAGGYLESLGYEILEYNYRCRLGEIDIVAKDGEYIVFFEVKYRADQRKGTPLEAVDIRKQNIIFRCAMYYLTQHRLSDVPCRFDVIGIEDTKVTHIKNAFMG